MTETRKGLLAMLGACLIWGCMPLIYKPLAHVPSEEVLAHRVIWSLVFFAAILHAGGRLGHIRTLLATSRQVAVTGFAAAMISVNWFLIIFATSVGRNTEGSLGYYIYPLCAVFLGWLLFSERLARTQWAAVTLAAGGVALLTAELGALPWLALALAVSFALYGVVKKRMAADPVVSVTAEMLVFLPVVACILGWLAVTGRWTFGTTVFESVYVVIAGPVTALPLILFSYASRRLRMATIGLLQYLNPTLQFLTAVVLFGEPFGPVHLAAFSLIWVALVVYSAAALRAERPPAPT